MPIWKTALAKTPKTTLGLVAIFWKFKFYVMLALVLTPTILTSVGMAIEQNNPMIPPMQLALRLFTADNDIQLVTNQLKEDPITLLGMNKPTAGIWYGFKYQWRFFWRVWFRVAGDIYLIFLPWYILYKVLRPRNTSEPAKNVIKATFWFVVYLFASNMIILLDGVARGNMIITLPEGTNQMQGFLLLAIYMIPFHGLGNFIWYLVNSNMFQITLSMVKYIV